MKKESFSSTESARRIDKITEDLMNKYDQVLDQKNDEAIRRFWKLITNIKGNLKSIYNAPESNSNWSLKANNKQLSDNLYKLYVLTSNNDEWCDDCKFLVKKHYDWSSIAIQIKASYESKKGTPAGIEAFLDSYSKLWNFCDYNYEELLVMISQHPYLSKLYTGNDDTIISLGNILI